MTTGLTLIYTQAQPGNVQVLLLRAEDGALAPVAWRGHHTFDAVQAAEEQKSLLRALRRALRRPSNRDREALRAHGRLLFDLVLPTPVKVALRGVEGVGALTIVGDGSLPWDVLHDGAGFLGLSWAIGRVDTNTEVAVVAQAGSRGDRLLVVADPADDLPAARYEGEALVQDLTGDGLACDLRLGRLRRADFLRIFKNYRLVHIAGHAEPEDGLPGGWKMADGRVDEAAIRALGGGTAPTLVFANACNSSTKGMGEALKAAGVRHFIGTLVDLPDLPGADFATSFYRGLRRGASVGEALRQARCAAAERGTTVWAAYQLHGDPMTAYFRSRLAERRSLGVRRGVVIAVRRQLSAGSAESFAEAHERGRLAVREAVAAEGGRLLPGRGAVDRAVFGVPISYENDVVRAARAGLMLAQEGAVVVIASGVLSSTGVDVVGPAVHQAEAASWSVQSGCSVRSEVARRLGNRAQLGPENTVGLRPLLKLSTCVQNSELPLLGRAAELTRLLAAATEVRASNQPMAVTVVAPAGVGKSRLVQALIDELPEDVEVLRGAGIPYDQGTPYAAAAGIVRALAKIAPDAEKHDVRTALVTLITTLEHTPEPSRDVLAIDDLLEDVPQVRLGDRLNELGAIVGLEATKGSAQQVPIAFCALIEAAARLRPLVLVFEDLHWLPEAGLAVFDELVSGLPAVPVLVVGTSRPDLIDRAPPWLEGPRHVRLDLGPLSDEAALALIRQVLPEEGGELATLIARAEGNPLFLRELALARGEGDAETPPATVETVVQARLDRLTGEQRDVLRAASIFGRTFWASGVEALLRRSDSVDDVLAGLQRTRFVVADAASELPGQSQWRFAHALQHEVVLLGLPSRARQVWHRRAALYLTDEVGDPDERWSRVAGHHEAAGDAKAATTAWLEAARVAHAGLAPAEARQALRAALAQDRAAGGGLSSTQRTQAQDDLARLAFDAADHPEAERFLAAALAATPVSEPVQRAERLRRHAEVFEALGDATQAQAELAEARALLVGQTVGEADDVLAQVRRDEAWLLYRGGAYKEAVETLRGALAGLGEPATTATHASLNNVLGVVLYRLGEDELAAVHYRRALATYGALGQLGRVGTCYNNLGILSVRQADFDSALSWYRKALKLRARQGVRDGLAQTYLNLGSLSAQSGAYQHAARYLLEAIKIRERTGHTELAVAYANLGELRLLEGRPADALIHVEKAISLCADGRGPGYLLADVWRMLADIKLASGAVEAAVEAAEQAVMLAEDSADRSRAGAALRVLGVALHRAGRRKAAEERLSAAVDVLRSLDQPLELGRAYAAYAHVVESTDVSAGLLAKARELFEVIGAQAELAALN